MATRGTKPVEVPAKVLSAIDRENPDKLSGQDLRELAYRRGLAKSSLMSMADDKIRSELKFITYRQYSDAVE
jgi:hypothetical protein